MEMITLIGGSAVLFAAGFAGWYSLWHRRATASFEKVRVNDRRSVHVVRHEGELGHDGR